MRRHAAILLCLAGAPAALAAQWSVGFDIALSRFTSASVDTTTGGSGSSFHPHGPAIVGVHVERRLGRGGVALGVRYTGAGVIGENSDVAVEQKGVLTLVELAPDASLRIARTASGTEFRVSAGPVLDVWSENGGGTRTRAGAQAAVSVEWPIIERLAGSVRAAATLTGSVFDASELPAGVERRAMWRQSVALGVRYRL